MQLFISRIDAPELVDHCIPFGGAHLFLRFTDPAVLFPSSEDGFYAGAGPVELLAATTLWQIDPANAPNGSSKPAG